MKTFALASLRSHHAIATITILALIAWACGLPAWINQANAAAVENFSDTLSDSDLSATAQHTVSFTVPNGVNPAQTVRITFDPDTNAFTMGNLFVSDITETGPGATVVTSCGVGASEMTVATGTNPDYVEFTMCAGDTVASSTALTFQIGSTNFITNPAAEGDYVVRVSGTAADSGDTRVYIIDDVTVSASVQTTLSFTVSGVIAATSSNSDATLTSATTTATTVPFGTVAPGIAETLAQDLAVTTNAQNGFSVTVEADQTLTSGNGADIDTFINGNDVASSTAWQGPANTLGSEDTYGHWGLTSEDNTLSDYGGNADYFGNGTALYVGNFVNNPVEVFYHDQPADGVEPNIGTTRVGYKLEIDSLQEAANDYTATIWYVATPVF